MLESKEKELEKFWWIIARGEILRALLNKYILTGDNKVLDVGSGMGCNSVFFSDLSLSRGIYGIDILKGESECALKKGYKKILNADIETFSFEGDGDYRDFDIVIAADILEHLKSDKGTLEKIHGIMSARGTLLVTVPANGFLWSQHDITLGHLRRYSRKSLSKLITEAGFKIERVSYFNFFFFVPILLMRSLGKLLRLKQQEYFKPLPRIINRLFTGIFLAEKHLLRKFDLPAGVSLVCIARK
ncbi:MAG: methyltransferase domain-containing protein [Candidatus Omnitrophica bacterium]|nr:methyltransferase domain-containing protein [Candidatus Omnitrophota bacterium]